MASDYQPQNNQLNRQASVWSKGRLATLQILTSSSSFSLMKENHGFSGQLSPFPLLM